MPWEDLRTKELVFRKIQEDQEIILKSVEQEDGKNTILFAIKNKDSITEIDSLSTDDWNSILEFLKMTTMTILQELKKKHAISAEHPIAMPVAESLDVPAAEPIKDSLTESIAEPIAKPLTEPEKIPIAEAIAEPVKESILVSRTEVIPKAEKETPQYTGSVSKPDMKQMNIVEAEPVSDEDFENLAVELQKVPLLPTREVPVVPSEEIITEIPENPSVQKEVSLEDSVLETAAELLNEPPVESAEPIEENLVETVSDLEPESNFSEVPSEDSLLDVADITSPPTIPKISEPSKAELESLLGPILRPKIPSSTEDAEPLPTEAAVEDAEPLPTEAAVEDAEPLPTEAAVEDAEPLPTEAVVEDAEPIQEAEVDPSISAVQLLDETKKLEEELVAPQEPVMLNKADDLLSADEKEAKIIAAMEEVAALMPPGPAKKFVEEMMLKRTASVRDNHPRIPQLNPETDNN